MTSGRVPGHGLERGRRVQATLDGEPLVAYEGESIAAAMMADHGLGLRETDRHEPRGYFCGMGVCFDCVMIVDGVPNTRTCVTWVRDGIVVERQIGSGLAGDATDPPAH